MVGQNGKDGQNVQIFVEGDIELGSGHVIIHNQDTEGTTAKGLLPNKGTATLILVPVSSYQYFYSSICQLVGWMAG